MNSIFLSPIMLLVHKSLQIVWNHYVLILVMVISVNSGSQALASNVQTEVDSINRIITVEKDDQKKVDLFLEVAGRYLYSDIDSCLIALKRAEVLAGKTGYKKGLANCYAYYGIVIQMRGDMTEALEYYNMSINLGYEIGDPQVLTNGLLNTGAIYYYRGDMISALDDFYKALKISERLNKKDSMIEAMLGIAAVFGNQRELDKSLKIQFKCLKLAEELEAPSYISRVQSSIATDYRFKMQNLMKENASIDSIFHYKKLTLKYACEAFLFAEETGDRVSQAKFYVSVGLVHKKMGDYMEARFFPKDSIDNEYNSALKYFKTALSLHTSQGNKEGVAYCSEYVASIYFRQGKIKEALTLAEESLTISEEIGLPMNIKQSTNLLYKIYKESGNYKEALEMYEKSKEMLDSMTNESTMAEALKKDFQYENEKKEQQMLALEREQKIHVLNLQRQNYVIVGLVIIALLVIFISFLLLRNKNIRHRQRATDLEQKLLRSQMNPHFIFNSLNSIQRMYVEGDMERANDYMGDFSTLLRRILESSSKKNITLKEELDTLEVYLEMEKIRTNGLINYQMKTDESLDVFNYKVPPLIVQPFVENAIWHGIIPAKRAGEITLELVRKNSKSFYCIITDNGVGIGNSNIKDNPKHDSKGILISKERLGSAGKVVIENIESGGTRVVLTIPIQK